MVASVTVAKILGLVYIVPLTRIIHDVGMGIYSNAYALYIFALTLSTSGFPTAMGKLVAERLALHRYAEVEQIYRVTMRVVLVLGILLSALVWFGAPLYSSLVALKESRQAVSSLTLSVRALAPALLVVPLMSALRGYLQGFQKLEPSAYSQALEQFVRVVAIVVGAWWVVRTGGTLAQGAAAATFGAFVGAVAGVALLMAAAIPLRRQFLVRVRGLRPRQSDRETLRTLLRSALPVSLGALVVPISGLVDSLTIVNFLIFAGASYTAATSAYGVLSRQAMQLIQLPLAFAMALGVAVLPAIAEAVALKQHAAVRGRIEATFRSMLFMTFPVAATLLVLGGPIDQILSSTKEGAAIISSVSFMSVFSSLELISTYMLQGLGHMYRPVRNMFIGVIIKLLLNTALIIPFHIFGAAVASTVGYLFSATLNVLAVRKYSHARISVWRLSLPLLAATAVCTAGLVVGSWIGYHLATPWLASPDWIAVVQVVAAVTIGGVLYVIASLALRAVSPEELGRIPAIGRRLVPLARRLQRGSQ